MIMPRCNTLYSADPHACLAGDLRQMWLKARHGWNWGQLRHHLTTATGRWQITAGGAEYFRIEAVTVTRYTYRGNKIPSPWPPANPA
jgi:hypothetical protein